MVQSFAYRYDSGPWRVKRESHTVSLVYLVYLVCVVEQSKPDEPIPRIDVSWSKVERRAGCAS